MFPVFAEMLKTNASSLVTVASNLLRNFEVPMPRTTAPEIPATRRGTRADSHVGIPPAYLGGEGGFRAPGH